MSSVIKVEDLSKQYRLGLVGASTIKEDAQRWWARLRGKEDPFLEIGNENDRTVSDASKFVWSLKDINFDVQQGDVLGVIGRNGAGKSTLLKILSKVTAPTTGSVKVKGRIASLLEVGTGFHPELTGKENIYLNGAILGMRKHEITRKLDEIIAFAGVEKYIDTPVKRYSSGMYVRLAFAVAAHLENEILIIDEVLAVGDAEFQKKCLGKMEDVSKGQGRTVLFVSHNLTAVKSLCNKSIVLENGLLKFSGSVNQSINEYNINLNSLEYLYVFDKTNKYSNEKFEIRKVSVLNKHGNLQTIIDESTEVIIETNCLILDDLNSYHLSFVFKNSENQILFTTHNSHRPLNIGENLVTFTIPANFLNVDIYYISFYLIQNKQHSMLFEEDFMKLNVLQSAKSYGDWMGKEPGFIKTDFDWKMNNFNL